MKFQAAFLGLLFLLPLAVFADDFSLTDGREYKGVAVSRIESDGVVVITEEGVEKLPFSMMRKELRDAYPYRPPISPAKSVFTKDQPSPDGNNQNLSTQTPADVGPTSPPLPITTQTGAPVDGKGEAPTTEKIRPLNRLTSRYHAYLRYVIVPIPGLLIACAALCFGWFIASRLLESWIKSEKHRELDLANSRQFHSAFEDFFAIRQLWNHLLERGENELPGHGEHEFPHAARWDLLTRAYHAESELESIFLKLAATATLGESEIEVLGRFRQGFHTLSEAMRNNKPLKWSDPDNPEHLAFNRLASEIAFLISSENSNTDLDRSWEAFSQITSTKWERIWCLSKSHEPAKIPNKVK